MKKIIVPLIITIIVGLLFCGYFITIISILVQESRSLGMLSVILIIALAGLLFGLIHNLVERIKEIKEEDKDDLSKYWLHSRKRNRNP